MFIVLEIISKKDPVGVPNKYVFNDIEDFKSSDIVEPILESVRDYNLDKGDLEVDLNGVLYTIRVLKYFKTFERGYSHFLKI